MQHSKGHTFLIHLAAALALCVLAAMLLGMSALSAHAKIQTSGPPGGNIQTSGPPASQLGGSGQTLSNPLKYNSLNALLTAVLAAAIQIGTIVLTIMLVWVGFKFVAARGNEEKIRAARSALFWTVIGGLILLGATAIQAVITETANNITA